MINLTNITEAVADILNENNTTDKRYIIERNQVQNTDESRAVQGWIGIYRESTSFSPMRTGSTRFQTDIKLRLEIQAASMASAEDCESKLEEIVEFVLTAIAGNLNLNGYVGMVKGFEVDYDDNFHDVTNIFYQFATITISCEVFS